MSGAWKSYFRSWASVRVCTRWILWDVSNLWGDQSNVRNGQERSARFRLTLGAVMIYCMRLRIKRKSVELCQSRNAYLRLCVSGNHELCQSRNGYLWFYVTWIQSTRCSFTLQCSITIPRDKAWITERHGTNIAAVMSLFLLLETCS